MFRSLLNFEWNYQWKQKAFWAFSFIFLAFSALLGSQGFAFAKVNFNSPYQLSYNIGLLNLTCVFAIMFFAISAVLRDQQHRMESLIFTTAISKKHYFWSRFLGILFFSLLVFTLTLVGFALGTLAPHLDPERLSPFYFSHYLWVWLIFVLPNVFICSVALFSISLLTKNNVATYFGAILIYALYWLCAIFFNSPMLAASVPPSPENMIIAALADPFGLSAFFEQTQYWTPFQKNAQQVSFSGYFMWNRLLWISFAFFGLAGTYYLFSFRKINRRTKRKQEPIKENKVVEKYKPVIQNISPQSQVQRFLSLLRIELKNIFKSLPFLAIILVWIVIIFTEIYTRINQGGLYNESLYPTTDLLIWLIKDPLPFFCLLLLVFYSGELVWRERSLNFNGIIDATPTSNRAFFFSKGLALLLLPMILISVSILIALGFQISKDYFSFELGQYLSMFYYQGVRFLFYTLLALFVQSLVSNKYLGMGIIGLIIILFGTPLAANLGLEHPLLRIGYLPETTYTNMTGFGDSIKPFHYYAICWSALGGILALLSFKLWRRGTVHQFSFRWKQLLANWGHWGRLSLLFFVLVFMTTAAAIYYNENVISKYVNTKAILNFKEGYERKFKQYDVPRQLVPVDMKMEVDLYPVENKCRIKAEYLLENRGDKGLQEVFISEKMPAKKMSIEKAVLSKQDTIYNTRIFKFHEKLLPGDQVKLEYIIEYEKKGFEKNNVFVNNGSFIMLDFFAPVLGYRSSLEIADAHERALRNLPLRVGVGEDADHFHRLDAAYIKLPVETIISTQKDQTAIASGDLIKFWQEGNRNFYQYQFSQPIIPFLAFYSGAYALEKEKYQGISLEQYYHPTHDYNIQHIATSTKQTLDYCQEHFAPYPFSHLRIVEIPSHWSFGGQAQPGNIAMVEDNLYLIDVRNRDHFNLVAKRTIHEVAHQYWGHLLTPKQVDGGGVITEGFAKYTEAVIMEKHNGQKAIWQLSESAINAYFSGRAFAAEPEPPLYIEEGQSYLLYGKSYVSLLAMKELIGEDQMNKAIRNLVQKHQDDIEPSVTSLDLLRELYAVCPAEYHVLIDDWFKRVITYDVKIESAIVEKKKEGMFEVTVDLSTKRFETKETGEMEAINVKEPISIGIFTKHPKSVDSENEVLYLTPHLIDQENMQLKILVKERPQFIAIDPLGTRLDDNRRDNVKRIKE